MTDTTPLSASDLNHRGLARFQHGDSMGARADFAAAAALDPTYAVAWNNGGLVRQQLGATADAIAHFDRAIAARPDYPEALTNRGRARKALGDVSGAVADFDRALAIDAKQATTYLERGLARKEAGDLNGALADFDRAIALNLPHGLVTLYHARGGVQALRSEFAAAIADYDRAIELQPDNFILYISRGNARYHRRDPRGIADYRIALRLDPEGAAREIVRLLAADVERDAASVLDNCAKHLRISDRDILAHARRGLTLALLARNDEAGANLGVVRDAVPDLRPSLERLVALARERTRPAHATAAWAHALHAAFAEVRQPSELGPAA